MLNVLRVGYSVKVCVILVFPGHSHFLYIIIFKVIILYDFLGIVKAALH